MIAFVFAADVNLFLTQGFECGKLNFFNDVSLYAIFGCVFHSADDVSCHQFFIFCVARFKSAFILIFNHVFHVLDTVC